MASINMLSGEVGDKVGTYKGARTAKDLIETVRNLEPPV